MNPKEEQRKEEVTQAREILWRVFIENNDNRLSDAIILCNKYIRGIPLEDINQK